MGFFAKFVAPLVAAGSMAVAATAVGASTITFGSYVTTVGNTNPYPTPIVTVNDDTAGVMDVSVATTGTFGRLTSLFFNVSGEIVSLTDILSPSHTVLAFGNNIDSFGGRTNISGNYLPNGASAGLFDFGMRFDTIDVSSTPLTFMISDLGGSLTLSDFESVGLRFNAVSGLPAGDSGARVIGTVAAVPLPASGLLLLAGVGGIAAMRRRKAKAAA